MNIDPKISAWINVAFLILTGITAGAVEFGSLDAGTVSTIKSLAGWGVFIIVSMNTVFHLFSAPDAGPLAKG